MGLVGFIVFLFIVESPQQVGIQVDQSSRRSSRHSHTEDGTFETDALLNRNVIYL